MNVEAAHSTETSPQNYSLARCNNPEDTLPVVIKTSFPRILIPATPSIKAWNPISRSSLMVTGRLKIKEEHRSHKSR